jgi:hypothetical protein
MVKILSAVLTDGLPAVEAACAQALTEGVHSADVILNMSNRFQARPLYRVQYRPPSRRGDGRVRSCKLVMRCAVGVGLKGRRSRPQGRHPRRAENFLRPVRADWDQERFLNRQLVLPVSTMSQ